MFRRCFYFINILKGFYGYYNLDTRYFFNSTGAMVRIVFGFGEALVTMPLLALLNLDFKLSISVVAIVGLLVAFPVFIRSRGNLDWSIIKRLLIGSIIGTPIGIIIVKWANEDVIIKFLGYLYYCTVLLILLIIIRIYTKLN